MSRSGLQCILNTLPAVPLLFRYGWEIKVRPTTALETDIRLASRMEGWQRLILLGVVGDSQLDTHLSHAIVCHAENASIRRALIEACLQRDDTHRQRGGTEPEPEQMPASLDRLLSMGQSAPVPMALEITRLRQAFYRRLRMLARRTNETRIARVCDEIYRQESEFVQTLRAGLAAAANPVRMTLRPRAVSPLDALLARGAASTPLGSTLLSDTEISPASPQGPNRPQ